VCPLSSRPADPEVVGREAVWELGTDEQVRHGIGYTLAREAIFVKSVWDSFAWIREADQTVSRFSEKKQRRSQKTQIFDANVVLLTEETNILAGRFSRVVERADIMQDSGRMQLSTEAAILSHFLISRNC